MAVLSTSRNAGGRNLQRSLVLLALVCSAAHVYAQKPVYRCETAGRVSYSDTPCLGAQEIDATPTQGMDKMTGKSRKGQDVQRAERNAAFAEAFQPLTGMNADEYRVYQRRFKLSPADKLECARLDNRLPGLKKSVQAAAANDLAQAEVDLYKARKRFNDLNC
ncbi:DUF4124 domain-containing protein [Comamonas piscis]|nr:DUF4124 domain-containing protein [Comamonas piscis]WSO32868.1 DUF4124 domain-containing protein [Comamonas piscis]